MCKKARNKSSSYILLPMIGKNYGLNSGLNSSRQNSSWNSGQNYNRIAKITREDASHENIRPDIRENSRQNSGPSFGENSKKNSGKLLSYTHQISTKVDLYSLSAEISIYIYDKAWKTAVTFNGKTTQNYAEPF